MVRYSVINNKNPREIILLKGTGCFWKKCIFCDYYLDSDKDIDKNFEFNNKIIQQVTGIYNKLEVINSGSFLELDKKTLGQLLKTCQEKNINILHLESHWFYRDKLNSWKEIFKKIGTDLKIKIGVETFDYDFRENFLKKGIQEKSPKKISEKFDECCLLFGLPGQTKKSMIDDINLGLKYFERVCINIFVENKTKIKPDKSVVLDFINNIMPIYINNNRIDILLNNTDFGVGAK
ncbi:MAG: radical SAM protein [Oscillospiraceae bacterium]|nr:radical SAM protein [Oscillospiraceae bacterium]